MALDSYDNLKAAVVRMAGRNDIATYVFDEALSVADAQIYANEDQPLRIRSMEERLTFNLDTSDRFEDLPADFLMMRQFKVVTSLGDQDIRYRTPEQLPVYGESGQPSFFTITSQIELDKTPDSDYEVALQYYKRLDVISETNTTNDILINFPHIYLYGILHYVYDFAAEEEKSSYYRQKFLAAIQGANKQDSRARYGSSPVMRIEGNTP